ncbi:hypothetical protein ATY43_12945 [Xanthomonas oryzae pv. oryzae]|nr:hypothetical protein ATY43_12945 [Xanthomonas oryzae pv. oryzae]
MPGLRPAPQLRGELGRADQRQRTGLQQLGGGAFGIGTAADHQDGTATQVGKQRERRAHGNEGIQKGGSDRNAGLIAVGNDFIHPKNSVRL